MSETDTITETGGPVAEEIIRMAKLSIERLPVLEMLFDRFALGLSAALKVYTSSHTEVEVTGAEYQTCADAQAEMPSPGFMALVEAEGWDGQIAMEFDPALLFSVLELMLGGRTNETRPPTPRTFTTFERQFGTRFANLVLGELAETMASIAPVKFSVAEIETNPASALLAPPDTPSLRVTLEVKLEGRGGQVQFLLPYSAIDSKRRTFANAFLGAEVGKSDSWRSIMEGQLQGTRVDVTARMAELRVPLTQVLEWRPGQVLDLGIGADEPAVLTVSGMEVFRGVVGRCKGDRLAVRVTEDCDEKEGQSDEHDLGD